MHVQKEAGADNDSGHEGRQSPNRQPSISQFRNSLRLDFNVLNFGQVKTFVYFFPHSDAAPTEGWTLDITMQKTS